MKKILIALILILPTPPAYANINIGNLAGNWYVTLENNGVREKHQIELKKNISKFNHLNFSGTTNDPTSSVNKILIDPISKLVAIYHWKSKLTLQIQYYSIIRIEQNTLIIGHNGEEFVRMTKIIQDQPSGGQLNYRVH